MKTKKLFSILLTLAMVLSLGAVTVFADEPEEATTYLLDKAYLTKDFHVADGIDIEGFNSFEFSFTAEGSETAKEDDHTTIENQTVSVGTQSGDHAYGKLALSNVFTDANVFPHAGEYVYTVKEVAGSTTGLTYDTKTYKVHVYVVNSNDDKLEFNGVTVENVDGTKVVPTIPENGNTSGFNFENTYKEDLGGGDDDAVLTVKKTVTGAYGDKTKKFSVAVTLTIPSTAAASDVAVQGGSVTDNGDNKVTFTKDLADGDSIVFTKLPAGTTFKVEETQDKNYDGKISGDLVTETTFTTGQDVIANSTAPIVDANGKTVTLTNNRDSVTNTGIIINNLPYILMVAIAVIGATYIILKKKRTNN